MRQPAISLVIPVYNEEENLPVLAREIVAAMAEIADTWEVLFVDDGSTDASLSVIRSLAAEIPECRYIAFAKNCGQSAAFAAGFQEAAGSVIVTLDADLQNDPADIPPMLSLYGKDGITVVVGWRAHRKDTLAKRLASKLGNTVRNWITGDTIKDTGCSLKVMPADMARAIPVFNGMHRFFTALLRLEGAKVAEMKVNHRPRLAGVSKYGIWDRARKTGADLLAVRWLQKRHITYHIAERKE
ncbi:MAG: Dodecaprenyl-phosphate galacturonate synthase [Desulfovibrio sp.]